MGAIDAMKLRTALALVGLTGLCACATEPMYAVRPGEPRAGFQALRPAYPVREDQAAPAQPQSPIAAPGARIDPEIEAGPPLEQMETPALRGHQAPGPAMPVRAAPIPALEVPGEATVRPGESIFELAERMRTPIRAIIDLNGLKPPYDVTPGATLRIPPPVVYTVKPGDTLLTVSRRFSIDPRSLANLNDIALETPLKPGQRLALPSLVKDSQARPAVAVVAPPRPVPPRTPKVAAPVGVAGDSAAVTAPVGPVVRPAPTPAPAEPDVSTSAAASGKGRFVWPIKGDILSTYGPKGPGQRNDGVNIAAKAGDPVHAAAAGTVVYAGNTIPGFGNLVVVKHPGGWTSLYGNLGKMAVKIRAEVAQGDTLGLAGQSGAVDRPQVHFEVRYAASPEEKARPVDPAGLLP